MACSAHPVPFRVRAALLDNGALNRPRRPQQEQWRKPDQGESLAIVRGRSYVSTHGTRPRGTAGSSRPGTTSRRTSTAAVACTTNRPGVEGPSSGGDGQHEARGRLASTRAAAGVSVGGGGDDARARLSRAARAIVAGLRSPGAGGQAKLSQTPPGTSTGNVAGSNARGICTQRASCEQARSGS